MYQIYNKRALTRNERFINALLAGIATTIGLTIAYGLFSTLLRFEFQVVYLGLGYVIGMAIQKAGRGVQIQFSILGAVLAVICFIFGDMISIFGFSVFTNLDFFFLAFRVTLQSLLSVNVSSLLSLLFRVGGVYLAYTTSRIV